MRDYLLLFRGGPQYVPAPEGQPQEPISPNWKRWMEALVKNGQCTGGQRLIGNTGTVLQDRKAKVTDGPFAEGKEIVAGYLLIRAKDYQEAISLCEGCPLMEYEDGSIEIREIAS